jgi:ABC-type multidrug transport system fused ATPase/permease subunit
MFNKFILNLSLSYIRYAGHLAGCTDEITDSVSGFLRAQGSGARLFGLLDKPRAEAHKGTSTLDAGYDGTIRFEGVSFAYPEAPSVKVIQLPPLLFLLTSPLHLSTPSAYSSLLLLLTSLYTFPLQLSTPSPHISLHLPLTALYTSPIHLSTPPRAHLLLIQTEPKRHFIANIRSTRSHSHFHNRSWTT